MVAKAFKPPTKVQNPDNWPSVFLAGSIDMGSAEDWQTEITNVLSDVQCVVLNPRRDDWDSSWTQSIENEQFREQVEWELKGMEDATLIAMCLTKGSKAPISLLELGLHATDGKMLVFCPEGFWRKGNVDVVCKRYGVPVFTSFNEFKAKVKEKMLVPNTVLRANSVTATDKIARRMMMRRFIEGMKMADTPHLELPQYPIQNAMVARELVKVAKLLASENTGLALDGMSNEKARKVVRDYIRPFTHGIFSDQYWQPVQAMFNAMSKANINWVLQSANYSHGDKGETTGKNWEFEVYFTNKNGRHTTLYGHLRASWCGSVADPSEKYDLVIMLN